MHRLYLQKQYLSSSRLSVDLFFSQFKFKALGRVIDECCVTPFRLRLTSLIRRGNWPYFGADVTDVLSRRTISSCSRQRLPLVLIIYRKYSFPTWFLGLLSFVEALPDQCRDDFSCLVEEGGAPSLAVSDLALCSLLSGTLWSVEVQTQISYIPGSTHSTISATPDSVFFF